MCLLYLSAWHPTCSDCATDKRDFCSSACQSSVIIYVHVRKCVLSCVIHLFRYKPLPDLVSQVKEVHHQYRLLSRQHDRLRSKIAAAADRADIIVDKETHKDLVAITTDSAKFLEDLPPDSFQRIFWQQQVDAAAQRDPRAMRWHPLMIRWCLYLCYRSVCNTFITGIIIVCVCCI